MTPPTPPRSGFRTRSGEYVRISHEPREVDQQIRTVAGVTVTVVVLQWPDCGVSVDVYDGPRCLTDDESFDAIPTDEQIALLIAPAPDPCAAPDTDVTS